ncbi:MAG: MBL fold metallo-hydrolase [Candidatus Eisenbacteria bacterium]
MNTQWNARAGVAALSLLALTDVSFAAPVTLDVVPLAPRVLLVRPETPIGNPTTIALLGDRETWLLDASIPVSAAAIDSMLVHRGAKPVTHVITSHAHRDHTDGLVHWLAEGAAGVATAEQVARMGESPVIAPALEQKEITLPTDLVEDARTLEIEMEGAPIEVRLFRPEDRSGHTDGDLFVYLPAFSVLYVGDYFFYDRFPIVGTNEGGSLAGYLSAIDRISQEFSEETIVIPGHNTFAPTAPAVPTLRDFRAWRRDLQETIDWITRQRKAGLEADAIVEKGLPSEFTRLSERPRYVPEERWIRFVLDATGESEH